MHESLLSILLLWFPDKKYKDFWFSSALDGKIRKQYPALHDELKTKSVQQLLEIVNATDAILNYIIYSLQKIYLYLAIH